MRHVLLIYRMGKFKNSPQNDTVIKYRQCVNFTASHTFLLLSLTYLFFYIYNPELYT